MKNKILLSIIIPCYNAENYIMRCVESLITLKRSEIEIIFVDDGSQDSTCKIISSYSDRRIKILKKKNGGPSSARNYGLTKAMGDYIMFVDSDDYVFPEALDSLLANLNPQYSLIYFRYSASSHANSSSEPIEEVTSKQIIKGILNIDEKYMQDLQKQNYNFHSPWAKLYKKDIIINNRITFPDNLRWGEDICFNLSYLRFVENVMFSPLTCYYYRFASQSLINGYYSDKRKQMEIAIREVYKYVTDSELKEAYQYFAARQYLYIFQEDLCNPHNKMKYSARKNAAWKIMDETPLFKNAVLNCSLKKMGKQPALLIWLVRKRLFLCINILIKFKIKFLKK